MASISEFYSRNLANEILQGSVQKAKAGGTPSLAPLGYLNVRKVEDGKDIRTIEVDPERGISRLTSERDKLLRAHYAGAFPLEQLKVEQAHPGGDGRSQPDAG